MAEKSTSQSSAGAMRARPLVYQTSSANDGKRAWDTTHVASWYRSDRVRWKPWILESNMDLMVLR
jgi:hypothetical protein